MRGAVPILCAAAVLAFAGVAGGAETAEFANPVLRVPKMAAPTIDGVVSPDEWKGAAAVTGFAAGGPGSTNSLVPEVQQVVWYLGFDEKYLYLAMRSPHAKGTYPVARVKDADSIDVLFEDHVEVQICPFDRAKATRPGVGFFKMMVNPKGAMIDQHYFNGTVGTEELWSTGGEVKCSVTDDRWDLEMSIEIARLRTQKLDGRDLTIQLVRTDSCNGIYFAGLVNATWLEWKRFAKVDFDAAAPVFQFLRLGEVMTGSLDASVRVTGNGPAPQEVEVELAVEDASGKPLFREKQTASVKPGESRTLAWKAAGLPVSPASVGGSRRNHVEITASYRSGGKTTVLYHNRSPFVRLDDEFRKKHLDPWLAGRPQSGEWECKAAYLPYAGRTEVSVDLDFFGVPKAVAAASLFSVDFRKKGAAKPLATADAPVRDLAGSVLFPVGDLPEGGYEIVVRLQDAGRKTVSQKTVPIERKRYPWERNTIGCSDEVIPPFTPVSVKDRSFSVWGRTYTIAGSGLPEQIAAAPPTGTVGTVQQLLRAPVRLEATAGGKPVELKTGQAAVSAEGPHRALAAGSVEGGPLAVRTKAFGEYDGWYQVEMTVEPRGNGALDALDLVFDMRDSPGDAWNAPMPVDTLYVQRMGDGRYGNRFGGIPRPAGVHFRSSDLLRCREGGKDWKSFVPITYVGNGDRGLWFFAWSDAGWRLSDERPMLQVERLADGTVRCRICLFAGPAPLEGPRTIRFALQAAPVKPNDSRYRSRFEERFVAHDTRGYRYWGDSVDGYALHREEDFAALRKFLLYGPRDQAEGKEYQWWVGHYTRQIHEGAKIAMYGSTWMTGMGPEEFRTFGGEWRGRSNWRADRNASTDSGRWNYGGTIRWTSDTQLTPTGVNWTASQTDNFVWYHKLLAEKCGFNGTWWDNSSIGTVREYDPELGRMDVKWNLISRRALCKRLNVMGWELMRPPCWIMNMHADMSWNQIFWMVENDWYADADDITAFEQWTLDEYRAMCRTKSTVMVANPWYSGFGSKDPALDLKIKRSVDAICLSHDVPRFDGEVRRKIQYLLDYSDTANCLFAGYWQTGTLVQPSAKEVRASVYRNARRNAAAIVFMNPDAQDRYLGGTTFSAAGVVGAAGAADVAGVTDLETGRDVATVFENGLLRIAEPFPVAGREYRILAVRLR